MVRSDTATGKFPGIEDGSTLHSISTEPLATLWVDERQSHFESMSEMK